jgi:hypothetical protein
MKKTIIAIWGNSNRGKTSTIINTFNKLHKKYPQMTIMHQGNTNTKDITIILRIGKIIIGIESQGDPNHNLIPSLKLFEKNGCDIILCATRTKGTTVDEVEKYENAKKYDVIWLSNLQSFQKNTNTLNIFSADFIISVIEGIINGAI